MIDDQVLLRNYGGRLYWSPPSFLEDDDVDDHDHDDDDDEKSDLSPTSEVLRGFRDFGRWVAATRNV